MVTVSESMEAVATDDCLATTVDGESIILHTDTGTYYGFNEVGTYIWDLLQKPRTVGDIHRRVCRKYDVEPQCCQDDVDDLLEELVEKDLVRLEDG